MRVMDAIAGILKAEGTEFLVGYPHNQIIDSCAAIGIRPIMTRTERVAINIADGCSRVSGGRRIGVCAVQYGPGMENGFGAVAQAFADASPVLLLPGGYDSHELGVVPNFQAVQNLQPVTKWVASINYADRTAQILHRAFALLRAGKPGPVVVEVPDDLMTAELAAGSERYLPPRISASLADPGEVDRAAAALLAARDPVIVAGQGVLYAGASAELVALADLVQAPVMTTLAGKSAFPENHPLALGTGGLSRPEPVDAFLEKAELVLGVGTSFTRSHYTTGVPPGRTIIQITGAAEDVGKSFPIAQALIGDAKAVLRQLIEAARDRLGRTGGREPGAVAGAVAAARTAFLARWMPRLTSEEEPISPYRVIWELMRTVDRSRTVLTHDSGNPRDQTVPFYEAIVPHGYIGWGKSTQLGTGLGLIMGAKLARPDWLAINIMGDASFGMVGLDLETAVRCRIPIMTVVFNNGVMGGYEEHLPVATARYQVHHVSGNYAQVAAALGVKAERVERLRELQPALRRAIAATEAGAPALVEVMTREEPHFPTPANRH